MGDPNPKFSFSRRPYPGSVFDFHVAATRIAAEEPVVPVGTPVMPIRDDMDLATRRYWARWNPLLADFEKRQRIDARGLLAAAGVSDLDSLAAQTVIERLVMCEQRGFELWGHLNERSVGRTATVQAADSLAPQHQVIIGARLGLGSTKAALDCLNGGIPTAQRRTGLNRHHVRYSRGLLPRALAGLPAFAVEAKLNFIILGNFDAFEHIRKEALKTPHLRHLRGAELAEAIHEKHDFWEVTGRAVDRVGRRTERRA